MFQDRVDAARQLSEKLTAYRGRKDVVVLAIPRGGVTVGAEVARRLGLPLDVVLTKKIGHPLQPEYAIGVVDLESELIDPAIVEREDVPPAYLSAQIQKIRALLRRRDALYRQGRPPLDVAGKTVLLVDDGVATGNTITAAVRLLRARGAAKIVVAVPVSPPEALERLRALADEAVCVLAPESFFAIGQFYDEFEQVSDDEAIALLREEGALRGTR